MHLERLRRVVILRELALGQRGVDLVMAYQMEQDLRPFRLCNDHMCFTFFLHDFLQQETKKP